MGADETASTKRSVHRSNRIQIHLLETSVAHVKLLPRVHTLNVVLVRYLSNELSDHRMMTFKKEIQTRDEEISTLRADMKSMNQSIRNTLYTRTSKLLTERMKTL